ncbi:MAG: phytanoyl-CoA dioxygenase family protein [Pseudomonadota bacterium]|nr:phytanoyl-CoA dioxygenase family protein [Pseudomonadota bacterium]MEC7559902.1 phytanoyl-CoA dioxygenase family protein [Pseudomonadota bacterium]MEC8047406.1 phytanoyl-CoA dioxygenase family protein [Pseudomonadota bacterium]MED6342441.1 phytanoyl-CoA dioxygenase family protein [Pseudomonadota bacterium]MEE3173419.1 phytanoyl-CoA dioxygenase family protein [Pseudomonadota bacterium]
MTLTTLTPEATVEEVVQLLRQDGALIIKDIISPQVVDQLTAEMQPYINATPTGRDEFTGHTTRRTGALAARSAACRDLIVNDLVLGSAKEYLKPFTRKIILHLTQTIDIGPGAAAQEIHRDRYAWGKYLPREIEPQFNTIWALTDFTAENGATQCVPGSQDWDWSQSHTAEQICQAEMTKGSVFIYSGSVLHAGGENRSSAHRLGLNLTYCLGWLRQEENQYLSCPPEIAKNFDPALQDLLGYTQGEYALGYYTDPTDPTDGRDIVPPEFALGRSSQGITFDGT